MDVYFTHIFQNGTTKWTEKQPLVYFPWGHDITTYQLIVKSSLMNNVYRGDNFQSVLPNLIQLTQKLVTSLEKTQCYILSFFNPNNPDFKPIRCYDRVLKSFYCINPEMEKRVCNSSLSPPNNNNNNSIDILITRKCSSGESISSLYLCDGYQDCFDGSDEYHCICYIEGIVVNDSIFCSKKCSLNIHCSCSILFTNTYLSGCVSFKNNHVVNMKKSNDPPLIKELQFSCGNSQIGKDAVDDLIFDCPNGNDEPELKSILPPYKYRCPKPNMIECYPGHSKCYTNNEKCVYNLTKDSKILMYCRNGQHLQDCKDVNCISMLKCPCSYCIPHRYRCDGKWDCWNGYDESSCVPFRCHNLFKCRLSAICIDTKNVCDTVIDCPLGEDEMLCGVKNCISQCICLNHGIHCNNVNLQNVHNMFEILKNFIFIKLINSKISFTSVKSLKSTAILICNRNDISESFLCHSLKFQTNLKHADLSGNIIKDIYSYELSCLKNVRNLVLKYNMIKRLRKYAFVNLYVLKMLDLSGNKIKLLKFCAFCDLNYLQFLNLTDNNMLQVGKNIFNNKQPILIFTQVYHVCCAVQNIPSLCTTKPSWPSSCNSLLSDNGLKVMT